MGFNTIKGEYADYYEVLSGLSASLAKEASIAVATFLENQGLEIIFSEHDDSDVKQEKRGNTFHIG